MAQSDAPRRGIWQREIYAEPRDRDGCGVSEPDAFHDLFSGHAEDYARHRPSYPAALYTRIVGALKRRELAWDCATGNGQAAVAVAEHVDRVVATDASAAQLEHAAPHSRVTYRCARAESSGLDDASVDLVTAAAAVHWFDLDAFYAEVRRVTRPGAVVAVWTYLPQIQVDPSLDALVDELARERLSAHWAPPVLRYVQAGYSTLPFPFEELPTPELACLVRWRLDGLLSYLRTWSAAQTAWRTSGRDLVGEMADDFVRAWGDRDLERDVRFPLHLKLGRV